jgi:hypothetical protein
MINGPIRVAIFDTSVFAIAGYYTDYDHLQHVVAAAYDGNVYEVHWDPMTLDPSEVAPGYPPVGRLWHFDNMVTIAGFFTPDDKSHHAVVGTINPNPPTMANCMNCTTNSANRPGKPTCPLTSAALIRIKAWQASTHLTITCVTW